MSPNCAASELASRHIVALRMRKPVACLPWSSTQRTLIGELTLSVTTAASRPALLHRLISPISLHSHVASISIHVEIHKVRFFLFNLLLSNGHRLLQSNKLQPSRIADREEDLVFLAQQQEPRIGDQPPAVAVGERKQRAAFQFAHKFRDIIFRGQVINQANVVTQIVGVTGSLEQTNRRAKRGADRGDLTPLGINRFERLLVAPKTIRRQLADPGAAAADDGAAVIREGGQFAALAILREHLGFTVAVELAAIDLVEGERQQPIAKLKDERLGHRCVPTSWLINGVE